ncbi:restriction endonuclease subunit S [Psychroserpens sp. Hel_I_66]|uniref:restriction endonuclease subunit S n=1 Tax=Psychroserpens sp. Hel_I_66 TaxID=1250004 RepID=UPI0006474C4A|nr:restriction endonuclease subunit S [Psychroserpens sp. Hel_I_66]
MMEGWKEVKIKDLGQVVTGNTPPRKQPELYGKHTLFIKPTDINIGEKYCREPEECYSEKGFHKYKKSLIPKNATCVVTIGSIGKKMIKSHTDLFINQAMNAIIPNENYDEDFIFYLLKLNLFQLKTFDSGTASGRENVSKSSFSNIKISVPKSKETQRKIASILSAYDDLIENNLKRIKLLEEKAQQTYEEWFVRFKFPGYETVAFDEVSGLPVDWEKVKLNEVLKFNQGVQVAIDDQLPDNNNERVRFIRIVDVTQSGQEKRFIQRPRESQIVNRKDLFMVRYGAPQVVTNFEGAIANNFFKINIINTNQVFAKYVYSFLNRKEIRDYLMGVSVSATMPAISFKSFGQIKMNLPEKDLQQKFHKYVDSIFELILNLQNQNQHLKEARDILLPRLMSGMIDVDGLDSGEALGMVAEENEKY